MNTENMLNLAKKSWKSAVLLGLLLGALSFLVLVVSQKSFRSKIDLLVVQNQEGPQDYYAMSRSADYLANVIVESVYSEKFLEEVKNSGKISTPFILGSSSQKLKNWKKTVSVKKNSNVGILSVAIFADSEAQAAQISEAMVETLVNKNNLFLGKGQDLEIRVLSGPIIEKNPSVSQIAGAGVSGILAGMFLVFIFAFLKNQEVGKVPGWTSLEKKEEKGEIVFTNSQITEEKKESGTDEREEYWKQRLQEYGQN